MRDGLLKLRNYVLKSDKVDQDTVSLILNSLGYLPGEQRAPE
jgi:hypothetical protein